LPPRLSLTLLSRIFSFPVYRVQEKNQEPMPRHIRLMTERIMISEETWERVAPSLMMRRRALRKWVRGKSWARFLTHWADPSKENQTSERNIMGQQIKLITPLVSSSFVPRQARINPRDIRLIVPTRKTTAASK